MGDAPIRIVIADDHAVVLCGLRMLLEAEDGLGRGRRGGGRSERDASRRAHRPAWLVLDLNMPGGSSLEAIPQLSESMPQTASSC